MIEQPMTNVADVITRHAIARPWAVAIIEDGTAIHYRSFERLIWAAAWHLRRTGVAPGDVVGLALPDSALHLVAVYALARIGAPSIALPQSDPAPLRETLARRFGVKWVVAPLDGAGPPGVPTVMLTSATLKEAPAAIPTELRAMGGDTPWNIRRTSGTTGEPKGIARTHNAALAIWQAHAADYLAPGNRALCVVDLSTATGLMAAERSFYRGGTLVIAPAIRSAADLLNTIDGYAITHLYLTPNFLNALLPVLPVDQCRCPGLLELLVVGMAMPEVLRLEIRRRMTPNLIVQYGANEIGALTVADRAMQEMFPETVGKVRPGVEVQVVDDDDLPLSPGQVGIVRARAPWMASGYLNPESAARPTFRKGWLYPGDTGMLNGEGMLFLKGRVDDMMNFDGIKIFPADIEEALLAHPAVVDAVAFPVASRAHQHLPAASVVVRETVLPDALLAHCRRLLGVRSPVLISIETSFPRNATGKVLRQQLAAKLAPSVPASMR